ncbi:MAG: malonyl-ACP O-methyltransferase BioC [Bacillota bacterium]
MIDKKLLKKRFSQNAATYDRYAGVQKRMAHRLMAEIDLEKREKTEGMRILEVGCGTGYLTGMLCRCFPGARITAVDIAPGMIEVAKKRTAGHPVNFCCGDIEELTPEGEYELVVSNATFQWLNHPGRTIKRLFSLLGDGGMLAFSTFGSLTFNELHTSFERAAANLGGGSSAPPGLSFFSLEDMIGVCRRFMAGSSETPFAVTGKECLEIDTFPSVRDFLASVKKIGAGNASPDRYCLRPALLKEMMRIYQNDFSRGNKVRATYHCLFIVVHKQATLKVAVGYKL